MSTTLNVIASWDSWGQPSGRQGYRLVERDGLFAIQRALPLVDDPEARWVSVSGWFNHPHRWERSESDQVREESLSVMVELVLQLLQERPPLDDQDRRPTSELIVQLVQAARGDTGGEFFAKTAAEIDLRIPPVFRGR